MTEFDPAGGRDAGEQTPPPANPIADSLLRLATSAQDWIREGMAAEGHPEHSMSDCTWCPLCQFVAVLRGDRPEVTQKVAEAGAAFITAMKAVTDAVTAGLGVTPPPTEPDAGEAAPRVQKIDLGGE
jgi:hypothetical protein